MFACCLHKSVRETCSVCLFVFCVQAQVLYDFIAEPGNNELTVKEGETVTITNQVNLYQHSSTFMSALYPQRTLGSRSHHVLLRFYLPLVCSTSLFFSFFTWI